MAYNLFDKMRVPPPNGNSAGQAGLAATPPSAPAFGGAAQDEQKTPRPAIREPKDHVLKIEIGSRTKLPKAREIIEAAGRAAGLEKVILSERAGNLGTTIWIEDVLTLREKGELRRDCNATIDIAPRPAHPAPAAKAASGHRP